MDFKLDLVWGVWAKYKKHQQPTILVKGIIIIVLILPAKSSTYKKESCSSDSKNLFICKFLMRGGLKLIGIEHKFDLQKFFFYFLA